MEIIDTAYNEFVLCTDCVSGNPNITPTSEFHCDMWSKDVRGVGICKFYRKRGNSSGDTNN